MQAFFVSRKQGNGSKSRRNDREETLTLLRCDSLAAGRNKTQRGKASPPLLGIVLQVIQKFRVDTPLVASRNQPSSSNWQSHIRAHCIYTLKKKTVSLHCEVSRERETIPPVAGVATVLWIHLLFLRAIIHSLETSPCGATPRKTPRARQWITSTTERCRSSASPRGNGRPPRTYVRHVGTASRD